MSIRTEQERGLFTRTGYIIFTRSQALPCSRTFTRQLLAGD
ncbi:hypothetical protein QUF80_16095 [Desulfococcaceae bacterium HSG8]|nr:hypothetical protein [Desulfococcaceae bacterium HSG8]